MSDIRLEHLTRAYGDANPVDAVSLSISEGNFIRFSGRRAAASPPRSG